LAEDSSDNGFDDDSCKAELANTACADHLSRKSSEGLRWIPCNQPTKREDGARLAKDGGRHDAWRETSDKEAAGVESREAAGDKTVAAAAAASESDGPRPEDNNFAEHVVAVTAAAEPVEPVTMRRRPSLPLAPSSPVDRQCLFLTCFAACALVLFCVLTLVVVYSRWTGSVSVPDAAGNRRERLNGGGSATGDNSGCDSFFSFSRCADSDMFG